MPLSQSDLQALQSLLSQYRLSPSDVDLTDMASSVVFPLDAPQPNLVSCAPFFAGAASAQSALPVCVVKYERAVGSIAPGTYLAVVDDATLRLLPSNVSTTDVRRQSLVTTKSKALQTSGGIVVHTGSESIAFQPGPAQMWTPQERTAIEAEASALVNAFVQVGILDRADRISIEGALLGVDQGQPFLIAPAVEVLSAPDMLGVLLGVLRVYGSSLRCFAVPVGSGFIAVPQGQYAIFLDRPGTIRLVSLTGAAGDLLVGRERVERADPAGIGCWNVGSWNVGC